MGFDVHCPMVIEDDRRIATFAFPGYIFALFDAAEPAWTAIDEPPRRRLMTNLDGTPTPVRRGYIEGLIAAADETGVIDVRPDAASAMSIGATVRIIDGPFAGFDGTVLGSAGKWIKLTANLFGRATTMTLPRTSIEAY